MRILEEKPVTESNDFDFSNTINIMGLISNILAIIYAFGPVTLMIKIHKKILKASDTPYMIMITLICMGTFWVSYGILKPDNKFFLILCNAINVPVNLFYLSLYFYYRIERKFFKSLIYSIPAIVITGGIFGIFTYAIAVKEVSQYIAMFFNITIYAAPGQNIVKKLILFLLIITHFKYI